MINPDIAILLTRPRLQSNQFAEKLQMRFGPEPKVLISPVIEIEMHRIHFRIPNDTILIFTSENAVRAVAAIRPETQIFAYCVGDHTAQVARDLGFSAVSAKGDAKDLIALIKSEAREGHYLYAHGSEMRVDVAHELKKAGLNAQNIEVYAQRPAPLSPQAIAAVHDTPLVILPIFSPRTAKLLSKEIPAPSASLHPIALSAAVAKNWTGPGMPQIATRPDSESMIAQIATILSDAST